MFRKSKFICLVICCFKCPIPIDFVKFGSSRHTLAEADFKVMIFDNFRIPLIFVTFFSKSQSALKCLIFNMKHICPKEAYFEFLSDLVFFNRVDWIEKKAPCSFPFTQNENKDTLFISSAVRAELPCPRKRC